MPVDPATTEERLLDALRAAGLRLTLPRRAICRVLAHNHEGFLTASEIGEKVAESNGPIDSSTVYRTLDELESLEYVHYVPVGNQNWAWHPTVDHDHHHLVCEVCGRSFNVPLDDLLPCFDRLREKYGFKPASHHFAIVGLCDSCEWPGRPKMATGPTPTE
jgi:Fur family ferric uptake transcriptional regulator